MLHAHFSTFPRGPISFGILFKDIYEDKFNGVRPEIILIKLRY